MVLIPKNKLWLTGLIATTLFTGCSKEEDEAKDEDEAEIAAVATVGAVLATPTSMDTAYPTELAISFFSSSSAAALHLVEEAPAAADTEAAKASERPIKERKGDAENRLKGMVDDCVADALKRAPVNGKSETCYEFDQDMLWGLRAADQAANGTHNGLNAEGAPCMVAFAKNKVSLVNDLLDRAQGMVSTMLCQAKKIDANAQPPTTVGGLLDLKAILTQAMGAKADRIDAAKLERLADVDGKAVYKSTVEMQQGSRGRTVVLVHSPGADGTYNGVLYTIETKIPGAVAEGVGPAGDSKTRVLSVTYAKVKTATGYEMQGDLIRANLAPELVSVALGTSGVLDLSAYRDFSVATTDPKYGSAKKADGTYYLHNEDASGQTRISFVVNPDTEEGTVTYAENPGSNYTEMARGMTAQIAIVDGVKKGCSVSGAAVGRTNINQSYSIAKSQKEGVPLEFAGFYHPFFNDLIQGGETCTMTSNPGFDASGDFYEKSCTRDAATAVMKWYEPNVSATVLAQAFATDQVGPIVTRQCYKYDTATAAYVLDTDAIPDAAGFELIASNDDAKFVKAPAIDANVVKPFAGDLAKKN